jgi:hypothetical protein
VACKKHDKSSSGGGVAAIAAVVVGVAMASGAHGHKAHPAAVVADAVGPPPAARVTGGHVAGMPGGYSPGAWATWFLSAAHLPETACDISAVKAWQGEEGTFSKFENPLDTTERQPGSWSINSAGVQHYTSWAQGIRATVVTLYNGRYPGVIAALRVGNNADAVARAVWIPHVWGTPRFSASC